MNVKLIYFFLVIFFLAGFPGNCQPKPLEFNRKVKGWTILSDNLTEGKYVITLAREYGINHLQLSHDIIHDLKEVRDSSKLNIAKYFIREAHNNGIQEVVLWDHSLYSLNYYPDEFKTGPKNTINLDNPQFWEWFKNDYREMLDLVPEIQGIVLTFIETGARVENQFSEKMKTNQEKLAAVVNAVASVVIEERGLNLYARTFSYTYEEYENITGAIDLFQYPEIRLMMKETPHDFFLTHPNDFYAGTIKRPTIIEFDAAGEFNGQGIIANTWPEYMLKRGRNLLKRDYVIGYTARTDRYENTRIVGRPSEINLYTLKRYYEDNQVTAEQIYDEFISAKYGAEALPYIKVAFKNAFDIVTSVLYTFGTSTANHSQLNYDPYKSHWARHVSGKWIEPPVVFVEHGVNREFHYWKDVVNTLAPEWAKAGGTQLNEIPWVLENGWLKRGEMMNESLLSWIMTEKEYGVKLAKKSLLQIEKAKPFLNEEDYNELFHYFNRTLLTARLHQAVATAYFGFRVYTRGEEYRTPTLVKKIDQALKDLVETAELIQDYPVETPAGQWKWKNDAEKALRYFEWITKGTWPQETSGYKTNFDSISFVK